MGVPPLVRARLAVAIALLTLVGPASTAVASVDPDDPPPTATVNEFLPQDRNLGDCLGAVERPGCGSEARGGWRQTLVFVAIVGGLGVIAWRVVAGARRARPDQSVG